MGYLKITQLYKAPKEFFDGKRRVYALEKIHGTSAQIRWGSYVKPGAERPEPTLSFLSGGEKYNTFVKLFDAAALTTYFQKHYPNQHLCVHGEAFGAGQQKMSAVYGPKLKFIVFDVRVDGKWLNVKAAETVAKELKLEFVHYVEIPCTMEALDRERDRDSVQAQRNGMGEGKWSEGIVVRELEEKSPPYEEYTGVSTRVIYKHKKPEVAEVKTTRKLGTTPEVLSEAKKIAEEWVTVTRLEHVLDHLKSKGIKLDFPNVLKEMNQDIEVEAGTEIDWQNKEAIRKAINQKTSGLFSRHLKEVSAKKNSAPAGVEPASFEDNDK